MNRRLIIVAFICSLAASVVTQAHAPKPALAEQPPKVDLRAFTNSVQLREGLRILERSESFKLYADKGLVIVETEPEPADGLRLEALGWESGPGMQEWYLRLPPQPP